MDVTCHRRTRDSYYLEFCLHRAVAVAVAVMPSQASKTKARPWKTPILPYGDKEYARPVGAEWPTDILKRNRHMRDEVSKLKGQLSDAFTSQSLRGFTNGQIKTMVYRYKVLMIVTSKVTNTRPMDPNTSGEAVVFWRSDSDTTSTNFVVPVLGKI